MPINYNVKKTFNELNGEQNRLKKLWKEKKKLLHT